MVPSTISRSPQPQLSHAALLDRIVASGLPDRDIADRALWATLSVLGQRFTDDEALALSAVLEEDLARAVEQSECDNPNFGAGELYERVRKQECTSPGSAREHVDIVVRALGEALDHDLRTRLARALPERVARCLLPAESTEPPVIEHRPSSAPLETLASGRPGSRHPLSEASPDVGQMHSVARTTSEAHEK